MKKEFNEKINSLSKEMVIGKVGNKWNVDGNTFNQLWHTLYPYVYSVMGKKGIYSNSLELEDLVADVRVSLYTFFIDSYGYLQKEFSSFFPTFLENKIKNMYRDNLREKRGGSLKTRSIHAFKSYQLGSIDNSPLQLVELTAHLNKRDSAIVSYFLEDHPIACNKREDIREKFGVTNKEIRMVVRKCLD